MEDPAHTAKWLVDTASALPESPGGVEGRVALLLYAIEEMKRETEDRYMGWLYLHEKLTSAEVHLRRYVGADPCFRSPADFRDFAVGELYSLTKGSFKPME
jgi:hypothetical protein